MLRIIQICIDRTKPLGDIFRHGSTAIVLRSTGTVENGIPYHPTVCAGQFFRLFFLTTGNHQGGDDFHLTHDVALFVVFVALLVVPLQVALVPLLRIYSSMGLNGTFLAVWLAHTGFGMPLAVYLFRNYMGSLPRELIESAKVDGAGHFQTFWRLIIPLSVPALAAYAIFQFLWVWNDLLVALVFLGGASDVQVVTLNLASLLGSQGQAWHLLTAGAFITMTVPLIVFFSLQRYFVRGLTAGSVKG